MKVLKIFGCGLALFVGVNTEFFADRGVVGWICYVALIVIAVLLAMGRNHGNPTDSTR